MGAVIPRLKLDPVVERETIPGPWWKRACRPGATWAESGALLKCPRGHTSRLGFDGPPTGRCTCGHAKDRHDDSIEDVIAGCFGDERGPCAQVCGEYVATYEAPHRIGPAGAVTPSVVCPYVGCDFHETIMLDGWGLEGWGL